MVVRSAAAVTLRSSGAATQVRARLDSTEVLRLPESLPIDFAKELVAFLNARGDRRLQLVLDEDGMAIERT